MTAATSLGPATAAELARLAVLVDEHRAGAKAGERWQSRGACVGIDPDLFFPERGTSLDDPKAVCRDCPVRADCLAWAIANGEKFGVWGGCSERERRRLRRTLALGHRRRSAA